MAETRRHGTTGYDIVGVVVGGLLIAGCGWLATQTRCFPYEFILLLPLFVLVAVCMAIPSRWYTKPVLREAGSIATSISLGLAIGMSAVSLATIIWGIVIGATFSDSQEAGCVSFVMVSVGAGMLLAASVFAMSFRVLKNKVKTESARVAAGTAVTLLSISTVVYRYVFHDSSTKAFLMVAGAMVVTGLIIAALVEAKRTAKK